MEFTKALLQNLQAPKRDKMPEMLNRVFVTGGKAITNNASIRVEVPTKLKAGTYFKQGLAIDYPIRETPKTDLAFIGKRVDAQKYPTSFSVVFTAADFLERAKYSLEAASNEETRYYLQGIYMTDTGMMVGCDGHRLHASYVRFLDEMDEEKVNKQKGVIIPKKAIKVLIAAISEAKPAFVKLTVGMASYKDIEKVAGTDKEVLYKKAPERFNFETLDADKKTIHFIDGNCIDGTYPAFMRVIPKSKRLLKKYAWPFNPSKLKHEFKCLDAIRAAYGGSSVKNAYMLLSNKGFSVRVAGSDFKHVKHAGIKTPKGGVAFNQRYIEKLRDGVFHFTDDAAAPVVHKSINEKTGIHYTSVVMPVRY